MEIELTSDEIYTLLSWRNPKEYDRLPPDGVDTRGDDALYEKLIMIYRHGSDWERVRDAIAINCLLGGVG